MRRLVLVSTLVLAGCATRPQQLPPVAAQQPEPVQRQSTRLVGFSANDLVHHFGRPVLEIREGSSVKLQFRGRYCVLDAYLYPGQNGAMRVTYVNARTPTGADTDPATCISALEYPS